MKLQFLLLPLLILVACTNRNNPQAVAEDFVYHYYKRANQESAMQLTSGLAAEELEKEIERLKEIRGPNEPVQKEMPNITYKQIGKETANEIEGTTYVLFNYQLTIKSRDGTTTRTKKVVITTENIDGLWKVVNYHEY
ncbi:hypothetical protein F4X73_14335 [Candidatus Poribacteria bacterium]|nr:hypothetical protein [Candidatus Poribacteria bacterium]MYF54421.1 hypothetical protein [Candidatus Poribacteria bacterium]